MKHLQSVKMFFKTIFHNTTIVCFPSNAFQILLGSSQVWISFQLDVLEKKQNPPKRRHEGEAPQLVPINTKEQQHYSRLPSDLQAWQAF